VEEKSEKLQQENFSVKMKRKNYAVVGHATYNFIFSAGYVFALIFGAVKLLNGIVGFGYGDLSAILQLVNNVQVPFASLSGVMPKYYAMLSSAERLIEIENLEEEKIDASFNAIETYKTLKGISFKGVTFAYDRDLVLNGADFYANKGEIISIKGTSGIGKSTLIKLMLGVYDLSGGEIVLDTLGGEIPLNSQTRKMFSYVPQGNLIFSGSILDNVTFATREYNETQLKECIKASCAEFIFDLPNGLDTIVGENGLGLSEGQVQRIAIARALLAKAPILLLDEATSALDEETEKRLLVNLKELNQTTFIISHRKSAFSVSDKIIQIKNKKIVQE
jgi:ATP-binding cassette subfamily B protein